MRRKFVGPSRSLRITPCRVPRWRGQEEGGRCAVDGREDRREAQAEAEVRRLPTARSWCRRQRRPKREKPRRDSPTVLGSVSAASGEEYLLPTLDLLEQPPLPGKRDVMEDLKASARVLRETLQEFGIEVESGDVTKGPTVTLFELYPAAGVRVEKISSLSNNVAMTMRAEKVRILAPVPGKGTVGIEVPNSSRTTVYLRDMLESDEWRNSGNTIPIALGRDVKGNPIIGDLANMPHLLIAGATGSGKTVCVNAILASLLYRFTAEDLRLVLIDPKMVEMQHFNALAAFDRARGDRGEEGAAGVGVGDPRNGEAVPDFRQERRAQYRGVQCAPEEIGGTRGGNARSGGRRTDPGETRIHDELRNQRPRPSRNC